MPSATMPVVSGSGEKTFGFNGQIVVKDSIIIDSTDKTGTGGSAFIIRYSDETTQDDGTITVEWVKYGWSCANEIPGVWVNVVDVAWMSTYDGYQIFIPGTPGGSIEITFEWQTYTTPPQAPEITPSPTGEDIPLVIYDPAIDPPIAEPQTTTEWYTQKAILDEGLWVRVIDDYDQDELGHLTNRAPDIYDLLVADEDDAEKIGQDFIYESTRKLTGAVPTVFNPFIKPGNFMQISFSSRYIFNLIAMIRRITVRRGANNQEIKYYFKEKGRDDE